MILDVGVWPNGVEKGLYQYIFDQLYDWLIASILIIVGLTIHFKIVHCLLAHTEYGKNTQSIREEYTLL